MRLVVFMCGLLMLGLLSPALAVDVQDFELESIQGDDYELDDLLEDKQIVVIAFWEVGCIPCTEQLQHFQEYYDEYEESGVDFVVISATTPVLLSKVEPFFASNEFSFLVLEDVDREVTRDYGVKAPPAVFVISKDREMLYQHYGYKSGQEDEVKEVIDEYLAEHGEEAE